MAKSKAHRSTRETRPKAGPGERVAPDVGHASESAGIAAIAGAAAFTLAVRAATLVEPSNWLWGLDTFGYRALWEIAALFALAAMGLVPPIARAIDRVAGSIGRAWERGGVVADAALSLASGVSVYLPRDPLPFTGDFAQRVGFFRSTESIVRLLLARSFPLDTIVNYEIPRWLLERGMSARDTMLLFGWV